MAKVVSLERLSHHDRFRSQHAGLVRSGKAWSPLAVVGRLSCWRLAHPQLSSLCSASLCRRGLLIPRSRPRRVAPLPAAPSLSSSTAVSLGHWAPRGAARSEHARSAGDLRAFRQRDLADPPLLRHGGDPHRSWVRCSAPSLLVEMSRMGCQTPRRTERAPPCSSGECGWVALGRRGTAHREPALPLAPWGLGTPHTGSWELRLVVVMAVLTSSARRHQHSWAPQCPDNPHRM